MSLEERDRDPDRSAYPWLNALLGVGLALLGALALAWPALNNGYPLVYQDTGWYLRPLLGDDQHPLRTIGYSLFSYAALMAQSHWSIIFAQSLVTSALLVRVAWLSADRTTDRPRLATLGLLTVLLFSGGAKYTSWLMADITASWLFLAGALWLLAPGKWDRAFALGPAGIAMLSHNSHLPLALATSALIATLTLSLGAGGARRSTLGLLVVVGLFVPFVWLTNALTSDRGEVLRGTESSLFYNLSDSGVLLDTLDSGCATRDWDLCGFRTEIAQHVDEKNGWILFDRESPFYRVGAYRSNEVREVVLHAFLCCAPRIIWTTAEEAWGQFWEIDSHDGLLRDDTLPMKKLLHRMSDINIQPNRRFRTGWRGFRSAARRELPQLEASTQDTTGEVRVLLHPFPERALQAALILLAAAVAAAALRRGDWRPVYLFGSLLAFLAINAGICAFGSSINARYQGRVAWLLPYVVTIIGWWAWRHSRIPGGGTSPPTEAEPT